MAHLHRRYSPMNEEDPLVAQLNPQVVYLLERRELMPALPSPPPSPVPPPERRGIPSSLENSIKSSSLSKDMSIEREDLSTVSDSLLTKAEKLFLDKLMRCSESIEEDESSAGSWIISEEKERESQDEALISSEQQSKSAISVLSRSPIRFDATSISTRKSHCLHRYSKKHVQKDVLDKPQMTERPPNPAHTVSIARGARGSAPSRPSHNIPKPRLLLARLAPVARKTKKPPIDQEEDEKEPIIHFTNNALQKEDHSWRRWTPPWESRPFQGDAETVKRTRRDRTGVVEQMSNLIKPIVYWPKHISLRFRKSKRAQNESEVNNLKQESREPRVTSSGRQHTKLTRIFGPGANNIRVWANVTRSQKRKEAARINKPDQDVKLGENTSENTMNTQPNRKIEGTAATMEYGEASKISQKIQDENSQEGIEAILNQSMAVSNYPGYCENTIADNTRPHEAAPKRSTKVIQKMFAFPRIVITSRKKWAWIACSADSPFQKFPKLAEAALEKSSVSNNSRASCVVDMQEGRQRSENSILDSEEVEKCSNGTLERSRKEGHSTERKLRSAFLIRHLPGIGKHKAPRDVRKEARQQLLQNTGESQSKGPTENAIKKTSDDAGGIENNYSSYGVIEETPEKQIRTNMNAGKTKSKGSIKTTLEKTLGRTVRNLWAAGSLDVVADDWSNTNNSTQTCEKKNSRQTASIGSDNMKSHKPNRKPTFALDGKEVLKHISERVPASSEIACKGAMTPSTDEENKFDEKYWERKSKKRLKLVIQNPLQGLRNVRKRHKFFDCIDSSGEGREEGREAGKADSILKNEDREPKLFGGLEDGSKTHKQEGKYCIAGLTSCLGNPSVFLGCLQKELPPKSLSISPEDDTEFHGLDSLQKESLKPTIITRLDDQNNPEVELVPQFMTETIGMAAPVSNRTLPSAEAFAKEHTVNETGNTDEEFKNTPSFDLNSVLAEEYPKPIVASKACTTDFFFIRPVSEPEAKGHNTAPPERMVILYPLLDFNPCNTELLYAMNESMFQTSQAIKDINDEKCDHSDPDGIGTDKENKSNEDKKQTSKKKVEYLSATPLNQVETSPAPFATCGNGILYATETALSEEESLIPEKKQHIPQNLPKPTARSIISLSEKRVATHAYSDEKGNGREDTRSDLKTRVGAWLRQIIKETKRDHKEDKHRKSTVLLRKIIRKIKTMPPEEIIVNEEDVEHNSKNETRQIIRDSKILSILQKKKRRRMKYSGSASKAKSVKTLDFLLNVDWESQLKQNGRDDTNAGTRTGFLEIFPCCCNCNF